jgi:hypothetical protein
LHADDLNVAEETLLMAGSDYAMRYLAFNQSARYLVYQFDPMDEDAYAFAFRVNLARDVSKDDTFP